MTPSEYFEELVKHDWYYQYADDHRAWEKGSTNSKKLQAIAQENDTLIKMYKDYADYVFKPLDERENTEAPQLIDYLS